MKVALLGGGSFLGQIVAKVLAARGIQVTAFSRREPTDGAGYVAWRHMSLPDCPALASELGGFDVIVYAIAAGVQTGKDVGPDEVYFANAIYPLRLLAELEMKGYRGRWVSFGSYFEIGDGADMPSNEEQVLTARGAVPNAYCGAKRCLSRGLAYGHWRGHIHHLILPTIYGLGEDVGRLIPYLIGSLRGGVKPKLSAGTQVRQYLHARDVGDLVAKVVDGLVPAGVFNVAPKEWHEVRKLVGEIYRLCGVEDSPPLGTVQTRDQSMQFLALDGTALRTAMGWSPQISLTTGLAEYLAA